MLGIFGGAEYGAQRGPLNKDGTLRGVLEHFVSSIDQTLDLIVSVSKKQFSAKMLPQTILEVF